MTTIPPAQADAADIPPRPSAEDIAHYIERVEAVAVFHAIHNGKGLGRDKTAVRVHRWLKAGAP